MKKKLLYLFPIIAAGIFSSCKKDYTCVCTATMTYEIKSATKSDAKDECDSHDNICPPGMMCFTFWNCELD